MKQLLFLMGAIMLLSGCSPRVVSEMFTDEYAATSPDSVRLFLYDDEVPNHARAIGKVKVVDNGFSVGGDLHHVMQMAIEETARKGGNGLFITKHLVPDHISTIHRIWGTMLRLPLDMAATDSIGAKDRQEELLNSLEYEEFRQYKQQKQQEDEWRKKQPTDIVRLSIGPSWMYSKYQLGHHTYKSRCGVDIAVDYDHVWKSGFGVGLNYLHNYTSFDEGMKTRINYIGPSLVMAFGSDKVRTDMAIGFGYARYTESFMGYSASESRVAPLMRLGMETKVSKHVAIGAQINYITIRFEEPDGLELKENEFYGIQRCGIQLGVRFYL